LVDEVSTTGCVSRETSLLPVFWYEMESRRLHDQLLFIAVTGERAWLHSRTCNRVYPNDREYLDQKLWNIWTCVLSAENPELHFIIDLISPEPTHLVT